MFGINEPVNSQQLYNSAICLPHVQSSKARPEIMDLLGHPFCGCKAGDVVTANIPLITEVTAHAYHAAGTHVHISKGVVAMATSIMNMSVPHHSPFTSMSSQVNKIFFKNPFLSLQMNDITLHTYNVAVGCSKCGSYYTESACIIRHHYRLQLIRSIGQAVCTTCSYIPRYKKNIK